MSVQLNLSSKDVNHPARKRHAPIFEPIAPVDTNHAPVAEVIVGILKKVPTPAAKASVPKPPLRSALRPSLSSTTPASPLPPQPVAASRSPMSRTTSPEETWKQPRSSNRQALAPEHFQKSSHSRSRNVIQVKPPPPVQQQQHVKLLGGDSSQAINESNRATLALLAEISELKRQNSVLVRGNKVLEDKNERLEYKNKRLESENKSLESENKRLVSEVQVASVRQFEQTGAGLSPSKRHASNSRHTRSGSAPANTSVPGPSGVISLRTQTERDGQDRHRRTSKEAPASILRRRFQCQICLEEHKEAMVVRIDSCGHCYCRECITSYVGNKLDAKRFPILCPVCAAEPRKDKPGMVTNDLVQQIGITAKQYVTWVQLEMTKFAVVLHCSKCNRWAFVDKEDFRGTEILTCPFTDCAHRWCKSCQQSITLYGAKHSCNGTLELDHLMKEKGWKYCPGCKMRYQKAEGCNHMTCTLRGCNTQFCYACGGVYDLYGSHTCQE